MSLEGAKIEEKALAAFVIDPQSEEIKNSFPCAYSKRLASRMVTSAASNGLSIRKGVTILEKRVTFREDQPTSEDIKAATKLISDSKDPLRHARLLKSLKRVESVSLLQENVKDAPGSISKDDLQIALQKVRKMQEFVPANKQTPSKISSSSFQKKLKKVKNGVKNLFGR